jgi:hypothetical protein
MRAPTPQLCQRDSTATLPRDWLKRLRGLLTTEVCARSSATIPRERQLATILSQPNQPTLHLQRNAQGDELAARGQVRMLECVAVVAVTYSHLSNLSLRV